MGPVSHRGMSVFGPDICPVWLVSPEPPQITGGEMIPLDSADRAPRLRGRQVW